MDRTFYNGPSVTAGASGGANIVRAKLTEKIDDTKQHVSAKLFGWTNTDSLGERDLDIEIYPHTGEQFDVEIADNTVVWVIRRPDAKGASGRYGRWELLSGPPGGGGEMQTIPFQNDSGYTVPPHGVMVVYKVESESRSVSCDYSTNVWTLTQSADWQTPVRVRYEGNTPVTSPPNLIQSGTMLWANMSSPVTLTLHLTEADAIGAVNIIDVVSNATGGPKLINLDTDEMLFIKRPQPNRITVYSGAGAGVYVVNEGSEVADGQTGRCRHLSCSYGYPVRARVDVGSSYYANAGLGQTYGPAQDSFDLKVNRHGFTILGNYDGETKTATVIQTQSERGLITQVEHGPTYNAPTPGSSNAAAYSAQTMNNNYSALWAYYNTGAGGNFSIFPDQNHRTASSYNYLHGNITLLVGADGINGSKMGLASMARSSAAWVKYDPDQGDPKNGGIYGIIPGKDMLYRGLPGFQCLGCDTSQKLMLVIADVAVTMFDAVAYTAWDDGGVYFTEEAWCVCQPYDREADKIYDGNTAGWPDYKFVVHLPRYSSGQDPNIKAGNKLKYSITTSYGISYHPTWTYVSNMGPCYGARLNDPRGHHFVCSSPYLDDKIGTVKMYIGDITKVPQGWREYTSMQDKFPVGVKANGIAGSVGATGGTQTHAHNTQQGTGSLSAGGATAILSANHLPPYRGVYFIERFE